MAELGLTGAIRGRVKRTTIADPTAARPADLVQRRFGPPAPNRLWVADLTYVSTWSGFGYVAFVIDAYARRILGWRVASTMVTSMVLDSIEQAIWTRQREGVLDFKDVVHHTDRGSQYTSIRFTERLADAASSPRSRCRQLLRQRPGRNDQRSVQDRIDQTRQALAHHRGRRTGHRRSGSTGSTTAASTILRRHPACRSGDRLLRSTPETSRRLSSQIRKSPDSPGRFTAANPAAAPNATSAPTRSTLSCSTTSAPPSPAPTYCWPANKQSP